MYKILLSILIIGLLIAPVIVRKPTLIGNEGRSNTVEYLPIKPIDVNQTISTFEEYYSWYVTTIAFPVDAALKAANKNMTSTQYSKVREVFEKLSIQAEAIQIENESLQHAHQKLVRYIHYRILYAKGMESILQKKNRDFKAQANNDNDEGNISYSQFISSLDEYAKIHNEEFSTPLYLY
jgi:hypothetical protein